MNRSMILYVVGHVVMLEGVMLLLPCLVSLIYQESEGIDYLVMAVICMLIGAIIVKHKPKVNVFYLKEGCIATALSWIALSIFGALPMCISGDIPSFTDALFETISGFTTTGASILNDVEALSRTTLFWRSFTHWIGGMGVLVIAGDIYDKAVPSAEAMEVLDGFIEELTQNLPELVIMMISGNHDSAVRVNCYRSVLARQRLHMIGLPPVQPEEYIEKVVLRDAYGSVNFYLLPFVKPSMVKLITGTDEKGNNLSYDETLRRMLAREEINMAERNVLVSHQFYLPAGKDAEEVERMDSEIRTVGNIDEVSAEILQLFDYAALGHIHKPMKLGSECIRYCGTMLACSVSEAGQQKGVIEVELGEKGEVQTRILPLHPLRQIKVLRGTAEEILAQACEDYVSVTLTDTPDFDTQDRLRAAFPYLLEIRRDTLLQRDYAGALRAQEKLDPYDVCCSFLGDAPDEEKAILQEIVNTVFTEGETK